MKDPADNCTQALPLPLMGQTAYVAQPDAVGEPQWLVLLRRAVADAGGSQTVVAKRLGKSRCYVSQVLGGLRGFHDLRKVPRPFVAAVMQVYGRIHCPHLGHELPHADCRHYAELKWGQIQGSGPERTAHWRACQHCPNKPQPVAPLPPTPAQRARAAHAAASAKSACHQPSPNPL